MRGKTMRGFLLLLLVSFTYVAHITSCPASCVVCSEDAIICHKLSNIIEVPESTKFLMLTDGQIDSVDSSFSDPSNMTMLDLSNNAIANITESAFQNLTVLRVLLLDHNLITSLTIFSTTFSQLHNLEILQLGNNAIQVIDGGWFRDMSTLLTLQLEGNLITRLDSATFQSANLENLETLDLSDNLIKHIDRGSFRALPRLRRLDLSRNSLRTAPDAFSYLSWLSALNLDYNQWNCTCELQELSSFLSSYMQAPDKVLYNGRRLVCLSAANPAVQTILQLTEANCVPPNENITVVIAAKGSISAHRYARDVALAATFFFAGGVGLTVGVLYIFYSKLELKKALSAWRDRNWDDEGLPEWSFTGDNKTQVLSITHPGQGTKLMSPNNMELTNHRPWHIEGVPSGAGPAVPKHHFDCHRCSPDFGGQGQYQRGKGEQSSFSRKDNVLHHHMDLEHVPGEKQPPSHICLSPTSHRYLPTPYHTIPHETHTSKTHRELGGHYSHHNGHSQTAHTLPDYLTIHCAHCLKTHEYWQAKSTVRTAEIVTTNGGTLKTRYGRKRLPEPCREMTLNDTESCAGVEGPSRQPHIRNPEMNIPLQRTVSFNLTGSDARMITAKKKKSLKLEDHKMKSSAVNELKEKHRVSNEKARKSNKYENREHLKKHKQRVQSNGLLKVKLNLNPFRKNQVHPKEHLNQLDMQLERVGTVVKKSKLSSKDKKIHLKNSRDSHAVSETKRKSSKGSKVSKTDHTDYAKKLSQSKSTKQSHNLSKQRVKSSRPKTSKKMDRHKHTVRGSCDLEAVDQEISESHTHESKRNKNGRQKDFPVEDDANEYQTNPVKPQEENSLSLSMSSKRSKKSEIDGDSQGSSTELKWKKQSQAVSVICQTSIKDVSNDETGSLELKAKEPLESCNVPESQQMTPKEVSNKEQPASLELKEGEEPLLVHDETSLATEKMYCTDEREESLRLSPNSSVFQTQMKFPHTSPIVETHMLDLGEALMEQNPLLHTGSSNIESIHEEGPRVIQEQTACSAGETRRESTTTMSGESENKQPSPGPVRPVLEHHIPEMNLGMEEPKPLSDQGSTEMLPKNGESESKHMDTLTVEAEPKKESTPPHDNFQGHNSDRVMITEDPGSSPQVSGGPSLPQLVNIEPLAEIGGSSLVDTLGAPDSQPVPDISNQMTGGGNGPANPLDKENLSNNNSMTQDSSHPIILQEYLPPSEGYPKRKIRLILPERPRSRPVTPLDKKIR